MKTQQPEPRRERRERLFGPGRRDDRVAFRGGVRRLSREDRPLKQRQLRQERQAPLQKQAPQVAKQQQQLQPLRGGRKLKVRNFDETKVSNDDLKVSD